MISEEKKKQIACRIENLVHQRLTPKELRNILMDILGVKIDDLKNHYINGKKYSDNEVYDDFYSLDLEICEGTDVYLDIYFFKTNERNVIYISEVSVDINNWK